MTLMTLMTNDLNDHAKISHVFVRLTDEEKYV